MRILLLRRVSMVFRPSTPAGQMIWGRPLGWLGLALPLCLVSVGCLAQKAELLEVQHELTGKLAALDKQERELSTSMKQARSELDKLIADTRARLKEEISNIREQELTRIQGKQDELDHRAGDLRARLDDTRSRLQNRLDAIERVQHDQTEIIKVDRDRAQADRDRAQAALEKLGQAVDDRLASQEKALAAGQSKALDGLARRLEAQGKDLRDLSGSLTDFRGALEKFKAVMSDLESRVAKVDERALQTDHRTKELTAGLDRDEKATSKHLAEVNKSMASITKTIEMLGERISARDQEQDRRLDELNKYVASVVQTVQTVGEKLASRLQEQDQRIEEFGKSLTALHGQVSGMQSERSAVRGQPESQPPVPQVKGQKSTGPASEESLHEGTHSTTNSVQPPTEVRGQESAGPAAAAREPEASSTPPAAKSVASAVTGKGVYDEVYQKFKQGKLDAARQGFTDFLMLYPTSDLAPNAQYWLGECYYGKRDFKRAIDAFGRVRTVYPDSEKVPAAMLKEGFAYLALKDSKNGSSLLKQVVHTYPRSAEAGKASAKLAQLKVSP